MRAAQEQATGPVERFAGWLWRRYRAHYVLAVGAVAWAWLAVAFASPVAVLLGAMFEWTPSLLVIVTVACGVMGFGVGASIVACRALVRPIHAWGRGDTSDPERAWDAALRLPQGLSVWAVAAQTPGQLLLTGPFAAHILDVSPAGFFVFEGGLGILLIAGGLLTGVGLRLLLRPAVEEMFCELPPEAVPSRPGWSLQARLLLATWLGCAAAGTAAAAGARAFESKEAGFAAAMVTGCGLGCYIVLLLAMGIVRPSLVPVRDLVRATWRVRHGDYTERVLVTSSDEFGELAMAFNEMQHGLRERESLHAAFGSYVDPSLAHRLLEQGDSTFLGEEVDVTVFFADVRDFTAFARVAGAEAAVARLNELFQIVVPIIRDAGGHANTYLGDGVLAVFGTPNALSDHADRGVAAAVEIQRQVRDRFGKALRVGIGVNTGPVIAGTIGGGGKLEFTVIGDTVNLASRVEALTKETGDAILITEATRVALTSPRPRATKRGQFDVRGASAQVTLHAVNPWARVANGAIRSRADA